MSNWYRQYPPYEGNEPYLYFAFSESDGQKAWKYMRLLLARGCRVWYSVGPCGSTEELLHRQERAAGAGLTVLYLTDAACTDKDTKSDVLVNQKFDRPILCLDPDGADRRLSMGLREEVPHVPLYELKREEEIESAILHAEGFSQDMLGEPVKIRKSVALGRLSAFFCVLALLLAALSFVGFRYLGWFRPPIQDEVIFTDPVLLSAVREAAGGGSITEELVTGLRYIRLSDVPESWDELALLPALERIELPQSALLGEAVLPQGDYVVELIGGGA